MLYFAEKLNVYNNFPETVVNSCIRMMKMRKKQLYTVVTFAATTAAMGMEAAAIKEGFAGRLIPVPGELSSGCGMAWRCAGQTMEETAVFLKGQKISFEGMYRILL